MTVTDIVRAAVLYGPKDIRIQSEKLEDPLADEVQIAITHTGICGSDLHYFAEARNGAYELKTPFSLGHEAAGKVIKLGENVTGINVGDAVALEVGIACLKCHECDKGSYNVCRNLRFRGSASSFPHYEGTLKDVVNHPAKWCHILPSSVDDLALGALAEPLSVSLQATKNSGIESEENKQASVLIVGAGTIGLLTSFAVKYYGFTNVVISDISKDRIDFATDNGFADTSVLLPLKSAADKDNVFGVAIENAELLQSSSGFEHGFDYIFECTGVATCVQTSIFAAAAGASLTIVGMGAPNQLLPMGRAASKEIRINNVWRYAHTYPKAIEIIQKHKQELSKVVTHRFELADVVNGFKTARSPVDGEGKLVLKVVVENEAKLA